MDFYGLFPFQLLLWNCLLFSVVPFNQIALQRRALKGGEREREIMLRIIPILQEFRCKMTVGPVRLC